MPSDSRFCVSCGRAVFQGNSSNNEAEVDSISSTPASFSQTSVPALLSARELIMKKKILSLREHYDFEDRSGRKLGEGDGNFFQLPAKFVVLDSLSRSEVMHIVGKLISLRHEFTFYDSSGNALGSMKKKIMKLIGEEYWIERNGSEVLRVYGNFTEHDYRMEILGSGGASTLQVAQVHKKWVSLRDQFGVSITEEVDHRLVIGAVIVVEHVEVTERRS